MNSPRETPALLVVELWGLGDLALCVPFLRTATEHARVTLLAKPHAAPLLARFAPGVELVELAAPWTAFTGKYNLLRWPWRDLQRVVRHLRARHFPLAASARADPRDHALMLLAGAHRRLGFPRAGPALLLSDALSKPAHPHRAEYWRTIARVLGWPNASALPAAHVPRHGIVIHSGGGQPAKHWPIERYASLAARLRAGGRIVRVLCDGPQIGAWRAAGEEAAAPGDVPALLAALDGAAAFIGNDSGPGHVAALLRVPTFTIFGNQSSTAFAPQHAQAAWIDGAPCAYKPCFDYCRFPEPHCLLAHDVDTVWMRVQAWLAA